MNDRPQDHRPDSGEAIPSKPSLDTLIAYFAGRLLEEEAAAVRASLARDPELRELAHELAGQFMVDAAVRSETASAPASLRAVDTPADMTAATRPHLVIDGRIAGPRRVTTRAWLASAAALLLGLGAFWFFALRDDASHRVSAQFARATQVTVVGDLAPTVRGNDARATRTLVVRPGTQLTLSTSVPSDAHVWFLLCELGRGEITTLQREAIHSAERPLGFTRYTVPERLPTGGAALVTMVAERPFDAADEDRIRAVVRATDDADSLRTALTARFGCVVEVRPLQLADADKAPKKTGRIDRATLRERMRDVDRLLQAGDVAAARRAADATEWESIADTADPRLDDRPDAMRWEVEDLRRTRDLIATLAARPAADAAAYAEAERLRIAATGEFARLVAAGELRDATRIAALHADCERSVELLTKTLGDDHPCTLRALQLCAKLSLQLDVDVDRALPLLHRVRTGLESAGMDEHPRYASTLIDLASACRLQGDLHRAKQHTIAGLRVLELTDTNPRVLFETMRGLADIHRGLGEHRLARTVADAAQTLLEGDAASRDASLLRLHLTRAGIELEVGDLDAAATDLERAEALARDDDPRLGTLSAHRAELALQRGDVDGAEVALHRLRTHDARRYGEANAHLPAHDTLAGRIAAARGQHARARELLTRAFDAIEAHIADFDDTRDRVSAGSRLGVAQLADALADSCLAAGDVAAAFAAQERARAWTMLELFVTSEIEPGRETELRALRDRQAELHLQIESLLASDAHRARDGAATLARAREDLTASMQAEWLAERALLGELRAAHPELAPAGSDELETLVPDTTTVWYYALAANSLRLYWLPPRAAGAPTRSLRVIDLLGDAKARNGSAQDSIRGFVQELDATVRAMASSSSTASELAPRLGELAAILVPDEVRVGSTDATEIVVVPDGPLARLPFEALVVRTADDWAKCEFLCDRLPADFSYLRSISTLRRLAATRATPEPDAARIDSALLVGSPALPHADRLTIEAQAFASATTFAPTGDPSDAPTQVPADDPADAPADAPNSDELPRLAALPETGTEVRIVESILGRRLAVVDVLLGRDATIDRVLAGARSRSIVHLASHGRIGDVWRPLAAGVALSPPADAPQTGALLGLTEIVRAWPREPRAARLVVLSACDTGVAAEGPFAGFTLPAAFHAVGVPSVIASAWQVDSGATVEFMAGFYAALARGLEGGAPGRPAAALREAKRAMRELHGAPRLWAAFLHFGMIR